MQVVGGWSRGEFEPGLAPQPDPLTQRPRGPLPPRRCRPLPVVGISVGSGFVVYKFVARPDGTLARVEVGRSRFTYNVRPAYASCLAISRAYFVFPEAPLYVDMLAVMGVSAYNSDDDEERSNVYYCLHWRPKARTQLSYCIMGA